MAADQIELFEKLTHNKVFASPFPRTAGYFELFGENGRVSRRIPWSGGTLIEYPQMLTERWVRLVVDVPTRDSVRILGSMHLPPPGWDMQGGVFRPASYTIPIQPGKRVPATRKNLLLLNYAGRLNGEPKKLFFP